VNRFGYFGKTATDKISKSKDELPTSPSKYFCITWRNVEAQKSHLFIKMLHAILQPVAGLIYSVLLLTSHNSYSRCCD